MSKPRVIKAYDAIDHELKKQLRKEYPYGFDKYLISFTDAKKKIVTALPYETEDRSYLIKMTTAMAVAMANVEDEPTPDLDDDNLDEVVMDLVGEEAELDLSPEKEQVEA